MSNRILKFAYGLVRDLFTNLKVSDIILFESINDFDGSSLEIYNYLTQNGYDKKYKLIWSVKNRESLGNKNYNSISYLAKGVKNLYFENKAKYVFFEDVPPVARRKSDQTVIYLTHGCPGLKKGRDKIFAGNKCDFALCTNDTITDLISEQFHIEKEKFFICGLPRNDVLLKKANELEKITSKKFSKVILWLPTFRNLADRQDSSKNYYLDLPTITGENDLMILNEIAAKQNILIIIKFHPRVEYLKNNTNEYSNIMILSDKDKKSLGVETYPLLTQTDALISDYSSITFDYMLLNKPIAYITDDMKEYKIGFALPNIESYMPGPKINAFEKLCEFVENIANGKDEYSDRRKAVSSWANKYNDGKNAERVVKKFIEY